MLGNFSRDNRRLYVFRVLNVLGLLDKIEVVMWSDMGLVDRDLTDGCHVTVRNKKDNNERWIISRVYRHCNCAEELNKRTLPGIFHSKIKIKIIARYFKTCIYCSVLIDVKKHVIPEISMFIEIKRALRYLFQ